MKCKGLALLAISQLTLLSGLSFANIVVKIPSLFSGDVCSNLSGQWAGSGSVKMGWFSCDYHGVVVMTPEGGSSYRMDANFSGGSFYCPSQSIEFPATCHDGEITIHSNKAQLSGNMPTPTSVHLSGTVHLESETADVDSIDLTKQ